MRRTTAAALALAALVGGWLLLFEREAGESEDGTPVFQVEEEAIAAVTLERPEEPPVRLAAESAGFVVTVGDGEPAPADATEADNLLQNVVSLRSRRRLGERDAEELAGFGLAPASLVVRVEAEGRVLDPVGFGAETPTGGNRYLLRAGSVLVVPAFAHDNFDRDGWDLRDRRVFRFDGVSPLAHRLRLVADGEAVELRRDSGVWRIVEPFAFAADSFGASQLATRLLDARMTGLVEAGSEAAEAAEGLEAPRLVAELGVVVGEDDAAAGRTVRFGGASRSPPGVFARLDGDPTVFVVPTPLVEELSGAVAGELVAVRSLSVFGFAAFRAVELVVEGPEGLTRFERRDGDGGREWVVDVGDGTGPVVVDGVAVDDLLYALTSMEADDVGGSALPAEGDAWTVGVREESFGPDAEEEAAGPEAEAAGPRPERVRFRVGDAEVQALRAGDARTLVIAGAAWGEFLNLFQAAAARPE